MSLFKYYLRVLSGMSLKKFSEVLDRTHKFSGKNKVQLTADMVHCARKFGAGYYDYLTFGFWDLTDEQRATYVTRVVAKKLNSMLNDVNYAYLFNDKEKFNTLYKDFVKRDFLNYRTASKEEVRAFVEKHPVLFCKPAVDSSCGHGCRKADSRDFASFDAFYEDLGKNDAWLLEEVLEQHPDNAAVYPHAINCMRIITLLDKNNEPHVLFVTQKFGLNGRVVDNYGFGCRVDLETGKICSVGVSGDGSLGITYAEHPMTHVKLQGRDVPYFFEACELAKAAARVTPQVRYMGWDVGITPNGPAIIEGNNYCAHDFWQLPAQTPEKRGMLPTFMKYYPDFKR